MSEHTQQPDVSRGLFWVKGELSQCLDRVRAQMEAYLEDEQDSSPLEQCQVELHQVASIADVIQCYSVHLLAREMLQTLTDLVHGRIEKTEASFSALIAATLQLADYIDLLAQGESDHPLVFAPSINELRVARGETVLSRSALFARFFEARASEIELAPGPHRKTGMAKALARKHQSVYLKALAGALGDHHRDKSFEVMAKVADQMASVAMEPRLALCWLGLASSVRIAGADVATLTPEVSKLLAKSGQLMKALAAQGERAVARAAGQLGAQLLHLLALNNLHSPELDAARQTLLLDSDTLAESHLAALRKRLAKPNVESLQTVARELRHSLGDVKDAIDLAIRAGGQSDGDMPGIAAELRRLGATLGVLGLDALGQLAERQADQLEQLTGQEIDPASWMPIAEALLRIEQGLESELLPRSGMSVEESSKTDLREGIGAVLRESLVNMARIKTEIDQYIARGQDNSLANARQLLAEVASGFDLLGRDVDVAPIRRVRDFLATPQVEAIRQQPAVADRFADVVAGIEYYVEAVQERQPHTSQLLADIERYAQALEDSIAGDTAPAADDATAAPSPAIEAAPIDPEFRDIFIEEAREVLSELSTALPRWKKNPGDVELLGTMRRAFHTLKGSGRMVGAQDIGEFGWAIEDLLNRCIEGAQPLGSDVTHLVEDAVELLPEIVQLFEDGASAQLRVAPLIQNAQALIKGEVPDDAAEVRRLFIDDAQGNLQELGRRAADGESVVVDEALVRLMHTLRGSAAAADAESIHRLAAAAESLAQSLRLNRQPCPTELLQRLHAEFDSQLAGFMAGEQVPEAADLQAELQQLARELPGAGPEVDTELAQIFAEEALSLLEAAELELKTWQSQPHSDVAQQNLQRHFHTLKGSARMAGAHGIGSVGAALDEHMKAVLEGSLPAAPGLVAQIERAVAGAYNLLDEFREGRDGNADSIIAGLSETVASPAEEVEATLDPTPASVPEMSDGDAAEAEPLELTADEPAAAAPETALDEDDSQASPALASGGDVWPPDPEILELFMDEAQELLESVDQHFAAWETDQGAMAPLRSLQRDLHTFKGGARMAGLRSLGSVAHEMESIFARLETGGAAAEAQLFGRLHHAIDGLIGLLDQARRGHPPSGAEQLLEDLRGGAQAAQATPLDLAAQDEPTVASSDAPMPADEQTPVAEPQSAAEEQPYVEFEAFAADAVDEVPAAMAAAADADIAELLEIFLPEGQELMEAYDAAVARLDVDQQDSQAMPDLLRVLHTLKGGARMAGLMGLGDDAHELETQLEQRAGAAADNALLELLHQHSDQLHAHLDAAQAQPESPVEVAAAPADSKWSDALRWEAPRDERLAAIRRETARVSVEQLDAMLNEAGEISIYRSRLEQELSSFAAQLREVEQTIARIRDQLRMLESETDAQIQARTGGLHADAEIDDRYQQDFDPLEMDRYSRMQELTRALSESVTDLASLHNSMTDVVGETDTLLLQQGRVNTSVQQGLMSTLMVPFSRQVQRLQRVARQTAATVGKDVALDLTGIEAEMDRNVLERMTPVLEHVIRNCVIHGIEDNAQRQAAGKAAQGQIAVRLNREGSKLAIEITDDGGGLNFDRIRATAIKQGLMAADAELGRAELAQFIFHPGFSTAEELTQDAGRGVGMDVVSAEVKQLGGTLEVDSRDGQGARFRIRLPLTLALSQALLVQVADEVYATPLSSIEGIARLPAAELSAYLEDEKGFAYGDQEYRVRHLSQLLGVESTPPDGESHCPVILVHSGEGMGLADRRVAIVVDQLLGSRELVTKTAGPQVSTVVGVTGATIQADGRVVLILDVVALVQDRMRRRTQAETPVAVVAESRDDKRQLVMVIDDSITMRRVAERVLTRNGYRVSTAKDGMDGIAQLQTEAPDAVLLDIEMPKVDGFEVASFIRNNERLARVPIVMITSRSGDKHRERAKAIGVNRYLIKPYQEQELIEELRSVITEPAVS